MVAIPIINLAAFSKDNTTRQTVAKEIYQACHEFGFMYLQNHGISQDLIEEVFTQN
jgi:isopenicillin N synthase-like dioxygenase